MIYGNTFLNEEYIMEAKFGMTKEEILKDPDKAVNIIKDMTNKKTENNSDIISACLFVLGIIGMGAGLASTTIGGIGLISILAATIIDTLNKSGKARIMTYSEYEKNARATKKTIVNTINNINKEISKTTDKQKLETLKKEKSELENILNKVKRV